MLLSRLLIVGPLFKLRVPLFTKGLAVRNEDSNWPGLLDEEGRTRATETRIEMTTALAAVRNGVVGWRFGVEPFALATGTRPQPEAASDGIRRPVPDPSLGLLDSH